jgi:hypothetical protein
MFKDKTLLITGGTGNKYSNKTCRSFDLSKIAESGYKKILNGRNSFSDRVGQLLEAI